MKTHTGMFALWLDLESVSDWSGFFTILLISAIISFVLIVVAGIFAPEKYQGLFERIGITPYQLYYFVLELMVFLNN